MQSTEDLSKLAIKAALNKEWYKAIGLNEDILKEVSQDTAALNRLARAYAEIGDLKSASKYFKTTLKIDPVNQAAERNLRELGKYKASVNKVEIEEDLENADFIIEPATTTKVRIKFISPFTINTFEIGSVMNAKLKNSKSLEFFIKHKKIADLESFNAEKTLNQLKKGWAGTATLLFGKGNKAMVLLKSPTPLFRDKKQNIRPYTKHERLEEIELELPSEEE